MIAAEPLWHWFLIAPVLAYMIGLGGLQLVGLVHGVWMAIKRR